MSAHTENINDASSPHHADGINTTINKFSPELIEERIRFNLKPSNAQIYVLIQFLKQLFRNNSVKTNSTAGPGAHRPQSRSLHSGETGASRTLPRTVFGGTQFSPGVQSSNVQANMFFLFDFLSVKLQNQSTMMKKKG